MARSGSVAVVSATYDADLGVRAGAAYVYERDPLLGWTLARKLLPSDGAAEDLFGYSLAVDGATVLVGAFLKDAATADEGAVYVFARDQGGAGAWGEVTKLVAPLGGEQDYFGYSLAVDGDRLAIGSPRPDAPGSVYLYARDPLASSGWSFMRELVPSDPTTGFSYGYATALDGDTLIVSGSRNPSFTFSWTLHVLERDAGGPDQWGETQRLERPAGPENDFFGFRVSLSGETLAVPSWEYVLDQARFGVIYLYERSSAGAFEHVAFADSRLAQDGAMPPQSLALDRDWLAVGTIYEPAGALHDAGAVIVFQRDAEGPGQWGEVARLQPDGARDDGYFGFAVALAEGQLLAGAPDDFYESGAGAGTAHEYDLQRLARAAWRLDAEGHDPEVLADENRPLLGTTWRARVDLSSAGRTGGVLNVYLHPTERSLAGGQVRLGRNRVGSVAESSPGVFEVALPPLASLIGFPLVMQAELFGGGPGFDLSNALDLVLGVE